MTVTFSAARWEVLREVAYGNRRIGVTASPIIDTLVREGLVECKGLEYWLTNTGYLIYVAWAREQDLNKVPGLTVRHARRIWRCVCADEFTGYDITIRRANQHALLCRVDGPGALLYLEDLRTKHPDGDITFKGLPNPDYDPQCAGTIAVGDAYAEHHGEAEPGQTGRRLCIRCAYTLAEKETADV